MVNQQVLQGRWNELSGKIREKWGQLTEDELDQFDGNVQQLIGLIQRKTGEARDAIETYLGQITGGSASAVRGAAEAAREYSEQAAEQASRYANDVAVAAQEAARQAAEQVKAGYIQTERLVRRRPVESLAVCFGVGMITGVVVGVLMQSNK